MIFVTLGTQDKGFSRLLEAIDKEIEKGNIKEKVVVQAGCTKYKSDNMEILDLVSPDEFDKLMSEASFVITHGGVGSILTAIKHGKVVIAAARLKKYKEHTNDHQKQIVKEFSDRGYILELRDFNKLDKMIEKAKNFKHKKFESNTDNMVKLLLEKLEEDKLLDDTVIVMFSDHPNNLVIRDDETSIINKTLFYIYDYIRRNIGWCKWKVQGRNHLANIKKGIPKR